MRFVLMVMAVLVGMSVSGVAQSPANEFKVKPSKVDAAPKSTVAPMKAPGATASSSTSKELRGVERETPKGVGTAHPAKKAPRPVAIKAGKGDRNPPMNFGKGSGSASIGMTKQANPYKGRLKQKGQGNHN